MDRIAAVRFGLSRRILERRPGSWPAAAGRSLAILLLTIALPALAFSQGVAERGVPNADAARRCPNPTFAFGSDGGMADPVVSDAVRRLPGIEETNRLQGPPTSIATAGVPDRQVLFAGGFGCANVAERRPATADTVYRIGSVTKVFQATWLMQLRDAGRIVLDQPVDRLVPAVWYLDPSGQRVSPTWKQLASHTAGLQDQMPRGLKTTDDLFRWLEKDRALYAPGSRYAYSDIGFVTLGQALAAATGIEYHAAIQKRIFDPLGMSSSTYVVSRVPKGELAVGYRREGRRPGLFPAGYQNPFPPSGTILSSANDMARFMTLYMGDGGASVLSPATRLEMYEKVAPIGEGPGWVGIGWFMHRVGQDLTVAKNGGQAGFTTLLQMVPEQRLGVVALINDSPKLVSREEAGEVVLLREIFETLLPAIRRANAR